MVRSPPASRNPIYWRHFLHFLSLWQLTFRAIKKINKFKKKSQWDGIKSQQDKNLVAAIQSKVLPPVPLLVLSLPSPLKLSRVSLCQIIKHCAEPESLLLHLLSPTSGAEWRTTSKGNAPARPHGTQELSVSEVWLFSSVKLEIHLVHRAPPVLGVPSRTTGVRLQVFIQTHMQRPVLCSLDGH